MNINVGDLFIVSFRESIGAYKPNPLKEYYEFYNKERIFLKWEPTNSILLPEKSIFSVLEVDFIKYPLHKCSLILYNNACWGVTSYDFRRCNKINK